MSNGKTSRGGKHRFKIEHVRESTPVMIFARSLEKADFSIGECSTLGGCKLLKYLDQPRALKEDGSPDLDVFVFALASENDRKKFTVGAEVEFVP